MRNGGAELLPILAVRELALFTSETPTPLLGCKECHLQTGNWRQLFPLPWKGGAEGTNCRKKYT